MSTRENLQKLITFFHISGQMSYNPRSKDMSESLLINGIMPHHGCSINQQENGFFVWTHGGRAIRHARVYAMGNRSLVTVKVPSQSVRFPDWKFDVEGIATEPVLLDMLCAKHAKVAETLFASDDFKQEMKSIIGKGEICLVKEPICPQIAIFDKKGNLFQVLEKIDCPFGEQIIKQMKVSRLPFKREMRRIDEACRLGKSLPEYPGITFEQETFYSLFQNGIFQQQFLKPFLKEIHALNENQEFIQFLRDTNNLSERHFNRFQMSLECSKIVVRKRIGKQLCELGRTDDIYEKVLNALVRHSPVMRRTYNELLQRKAHNQSIGTVIKNVFYPEPSDVEFPLKYTGNKKLPVYSITRLSRYVDEKDRLYAMSLPKSR